MSLPPVECKYITVDFIHEWKSSNGNPSSKLPDPVPMLRFVYELCWNMVRGELPLQKCRPILDSVAFLDKPTNQEVGSTFADIVSQMALDLTLNGDSRSRLVKLAKLLVELTVVPLRLFHERCEEEFLWEAELIKIKAPELKNKEVRVNTRLLYQQTKFNLIREESEGYAKLVTLLCHRSEASSHNSTSATIGIIKSLIGHFDLDPNRVFDIVLECFELQPDSNIFMELIPIFPKSHASQILGFKFQHYHREVNTPVPFGLYKLTALLVKKDFIDLDSVCLHILTKDDEAIKNFTSFSAKRLEEANKIGKINLAATGKDLMEDEKQGDVSIDLFSALDMEAEAVTERLPELENNQSLGLLCGFLAVEDWCHANMLFDRLSPLIPAAHLQICHGLFRLIEKTISPAYRIVRQIHFQSFGFVLGVGGDPMDSTETVGDKSFVDLPKELFQMLACIGPYLYRDSMLLQKVCRVLRGYLVSADELASGSSNEVNPKFVTGESKPPRLHLKEARLRVEEALGNCILPSLQLVPANPAIGQGIWEVLNLLPYEVRYRLYGEWEKDDEKMPMILAARQIAKLDTRRILKRLAKENLKQLGRMVAKLAHANPMIVLRTIVKQIESYKDMITPVVDAFKYLTQFEYDILEYVVIERLAQGRLKLKDDGLNLSDWLQSLASFWGHLCKKYPSMELRGLFQYLVNQLKRGQGIELVLLQELIQQMANVQYTENLTEDQLDAMAGSETLRYQVTSFGVTRNNKALIKSTNRLRDSLFPKDEPKLAVPLLLLIAQHRSVVVIKAEAPYIKMVSEQFDRCHGTLLQYVDFLCSAVAPASAYGHLIPPLDDLVHLYHLDPEVAFLIYRPVMRLFKYRTSLGVCWPLNHKEATSLTSESEDMPPELVLDLGSPRKPIKWSDLLDIVKTMLPVKTWNRLSPDLYATFWGLTLYDLYVPRSRYESEISKQYAALKSLEELSDNSSSAITKRKKEKERIQDSLDRLTNELSKHEQHVASVRARLSREKDKWLSSCPDTVKINMEFLQRCIFPRCTFSMPDAVYCAMFVNTLHSLGTPFFNTVKHINVLICMTLQPMICCSTEYEVGRLGRFLYETLKTAYHWKSDESIYERECGNMPGFASNCRDPNSVRLPYGQFIKVHWRWSQRITKLLIHCLESTEYMEIRNALIMLTKISGIFPVTWKTGINLEKRVAKIRSDEREDLKVLATGVAAALAARKPFWVTDEEFGMGYLDLKVAAPPLPSKNVASATAAIIVDPSESIGGRHGASENHPIDSGNTNKELTSTRTKHAEGRQEKMEQSSLAKSDAGSVRVKLSVSGVDAQTSSAAAAQGQVNQKHFGEGSLAQPSHKGAPEPEVKVSSKRGIPAGSLKPPKLESGKDDGKPGKAVAKSWAPAANNSSQATEGGSRAANVSSSSTTTPVATNGRSSVKISSASTRASDTHGGGEAKAESGGSKSGGAGKDDGGSGDKKMHKRSSPSEDVERMNKRRKGEKSDVRGDIEGERSMDRMGNDDHGSSSMHKKASSDKGVDNRSSKDRYERGGGEHKERGGDEKTTRDSSSRSSMERHHGRERSVERGGSSVKELKEERSSKSMSSSSHGHGQGLLPPPPPLPPHVVPQSVVGNRRDDYDGGDSRRLSTRHSSSSSQRLSPRHEERERRRSEENIVSQDDTKRRRGDDDRKREDRESQLLIKQGEERGERDRERANVSKEDMDSSKRRKLKREQQMSSTESGEYSPPPPTTTSSVLSSQQQQHYESSRDRDRKAAAAAAMAQQRPVYLEEPRIHSKDVTAAKMGGRRDDAMYDREWDEEKRQRGGGEPKRRHRK